MTDHGRLHPRLLRSQAERRFDALASLELDALRSASACSDPTAVYAATGASRISVAELDGLRSRVRTLAENHGYPEAPPRRAAAAFDRATAGMLLESALLFPAEATAPEIWSFHGLVLLPDVVFWRWRDETGAINRERIIGSDLTRHALGRLWWRSYLLCARPDGSTDLAGLARLEIFGEADFDHIQARRRAYGASPRVLQRLTTLWMETEDDLEGNAVSDRVILRELLKRLLRLGAFIRFDLLDDAMLDSELRRALNETLDSLSVHSAGVGESGQP